MKQFSFNSKVIIIYKQKQSCWFVFLKTSTSERTRLLLFRHPRLKGDSKGLLSLSLLYRKLYFFGLIF